MAGRIAKIRFRFYLSYLCKYLCMSVRIIYLRVYPSLSLSLSLSLIMIANISIYLSIIRTNVKESIRCVPISKYDWLFKNRITTLCRHLKIERQCIVAIVQLIKPIYLVLFSNWNRIMLSLCLEKMHIVGNIYCKLASAMYSRCVQIRVISWLGLSV